MNNKTHSLLRNNTTVSNKKLGTSIPSEKSISDKNSLKPLHKNREERKASLGEDSGEEEAYNDKVENKSQQSNLSKSNVVKTESSKRSSIISSEEFSHPNETQPIVKSNL